MGLNLSFHFLSGSIPVPINWCFVWTGLTRLCSVTASKSTRYSLSPSHTAPRMLSISWVYLTNDGEMHRTGAEREWSTSLRLERAVRLISHWEDGVLWLLSQDRRGEPMVLSLFTCSARNLIAEKDDSKVLQYSVIWTCSARYVVARASSSLRLVSRLCANIFWRLAIRSS
jgi:hypothetical protein